MHCKLEEANFSPLFGAWVIIHCLVLRVCFWAVCAINLQWYLQDSHVHTPFLKVEPNRENSADRQKGLHRHVK